MDLKLELSEELQAQLSDSIRQLYLEALEIARRDSSVLKEYLSIDEACKYLNCSRNTFMTNHVEKYGLPIIHIESKKYIAKSDIHELMSRNKI